MRFGGRAEIFMAVHRLEFSVHYRRLEPGEFAVLAGLQRGLSIGDAIESALADRADETEDYADKVQEWFGIWSKLGWLSRGARRGLVRRAGSTSKEGKMSTSYEKCIWAYENFATVSSALRSPLLLALRLYWGFLFAQTGWGKLQNLERVTGYFTSLGIPFPHANAIFVAGLESRWGNLADPWPRFATDRSSADGRYGGRLSYSRPGSSTRHLLRSTHRSSTPLRSRFCLPHF